MGGQSESENQSPPPLETWRVITIGLMIGIPALILIVMLVSGTGDTDNLAKAAQMTGQQQPVPPSIPSVASIEGEVADEAIAQYRITAVSGTKADKCVQAGVVAAAFLQKQEPLRYAYWKKAEHS